MSNSHNSPTLSIDFSDLPDEVGDAVRILTDFILKPHRSDPLSPETFAVAESHVKTAVLTLGCNMLKDFIEGRDDGRPRIRHDGKTLYRYPEKPKSIMTVLGPVSARASGRAGRGLRSSRSMRGWASSMTT